MNGYRNGGNGEVDGPANISSAGPCSLQWKLGLLHSRGRYLTAETFGFKINATGTALRKKQLWTIEYHPSEGDTVFIRSHLGRYLSGDRRGNAACCSEELTEAERFSVECHLDGSGRWAIRNRSTGFYFGGSDERLICHEKQPSPDDWWTPHFAFPPQVNLRSVHRQKYACLHLASEDEDQEDSDSIRICTLIPWGWRALFSLEFVDGRYAIRTNDDRYLHRDGSLVSGPPPPDATFAVELKAGGAGLALRDRAAKYLTGVGRDAVVQARNSSAGKDELFTVEEGHPQVVILAHNGKMVSIRQGFRLSLPS